MGTRYKIRARFFAHFKSMCEKPCWPEYAGTTYSLLYTIRLEEQNLCNCYTRQIYRSKALLWNKNKLFTSLAKTGLRSNLSVKI